MKYIFHPDAESEFQDAINFYEERQNGLGYDFSLEIYSAIRRIVENPKAWTKLDGDMRRCIANRFPYGIVYTELEDCIYILAIMNLRRRPGYWKNRLRSL